MADIDLSEFESFDWRTPEKCLIGRHLETLSKQDRGKLEAALLSKHITHMGVSKWLKTRGLRASDHTVRKHRMGECCCGR